MLYPKAHMPLRVSSLSIAITLLLASTTASAQSTPDEAVDLDSISVTGVRASIQKSLVEKHSASGIVDTISAEDMGKFPDLNLSESLQRIPGLTLERNGVGEGATINLRGLGPEFTSVEINGMSGVGNGGETRYTTRTEGSRAFNFEMFSSELFSRTTVYKTGMAEVDEGGLAGTVRMETPRPLDGEGTRMAASLLGNYSELGDTTNPRTAVLFSHNHNDIFGIAASVAWSQTDFTSYEVKANGWQPLSTFNRACTGGDVCDALVPLQPGYYVFNEDRTTTGGTLTLQLRPNDQFQISLDGLYGRRKSEHLQHRPDYPIDNGVGMPIDPVIENGVITAATFERVRLRSAPRFLSSDEDFQQLVLRAEWTPDEYWSVRPMLGYARREVDRSFDLFAFSMIGDESNPNPFVPGPPGSELRYRIRGDYLDFASNASDLSANPEDFVFSVFLMNPTYNKNVAKQARVDVDRHFASNDHVLKFGVRYNQTQMQHRSTEWWLSRDAGTLPSDLPNMDSVGRYVDYKLRGAAGNTPSRLFVVDRQQVWNTFMPGGIPIQGTLVRDFPATQAQQSYLIEEKTGSAWMQMDLLFDRWTLIPGVRYVRTEQISSGFDVINANQASQQITPIQFSKTYNGILPSLTARYDLSRRSVLRGAYARTLTRPGLGSLAPGENLVVTGDGQGTARRGNPNLEPYYAHNFDLGAEWYVSSDSMLAANVFYKKASNFIDNQSSEVERIIPRQTGAPGELINGRITLTEPVNGVSATIKGIELSAQTRFSRLPGWLSHFGGILNYTHTDSSADFSQEGDVRSQGLPGLSKNSVNAILYYDNGRLDTRLSYAWRDDYLATIAEEPGGIPRFTKAYGQLDFSLNWRATDHLSFQAQIVNLTREQRIDQSTALRLPFGVTELDRRFLIGVRVAF